MTALASPEAFIELAERVIDVLHEHGLDALVIGGFALAVHRCPRATDDLDLGTSTTLTGLRAVRDTLEQRGYSAELSEPGGHDHLNGVVNVQHDGALVQVVNFGERFPAAIDDALQAATIVGGSRLRAIPLPFLIVLKIYAGLGPQSRADIAALLAANPDADIAKIRDLCIKYRVGGWQDVLPSE